ncbi:MAG: hypothetical protein ACFB2Z_06610 [Maricaulaceae bacterium]
MDEVLNLDLDVTRMSASLTDHFGGLAGRTETGGQVGAPFGEESSTIDTVLHDETADAGFDAFFGDAEPVQTDFLATFADTNGQVSESSLASFRPSNATETSPGHETEASTDGAATDGGTTSPDTDPTQTVVSAPVPPPPNPFLESLYYSNQEANVADPLGLLDSHGIINIDEALWDQNRQETSDPDEIEIIVVIGYRPQGYEFSGLGGGYFGPFTNVSNRGFDAELQVDIDSFWERQFLYCDIDGAIHELSEIISEHTDFFSAASRVSSFLNFTQIGFDVPLSVAYSGLPFPFDIIAQSTLPDHVRIGFKDDVKNWFSDLGLKLAEHNIHMANRIANNNFPGVTDTNDRNWANSNMIYHEQIYIHNELVDLYNSDIDLYGRVVGAGNLLLNSGVWGSNLYNGPLTAARSSLGVPFNFADTSHRIELGEEFTQDAIEDRNNNQGGSPCFPWSD